MGNGPSLFEHENRQGQKIQAMLGGRFLEKPGVTEVREWPDLRNQGFNDRGSSLEVPAGYRVDLFEHVDFMGQKLSLGPGTYNSLPNGWNDLVSSMRFTWSPPSEACDPAAVGYYVNTNIDAPGNDIKNGGTNLCNLISTCNADTSCQGFNVGGWVKNDVSNWVPQENTTLYSRSPLRPINVSGTWQLNLEGKSDYVQVKDSGRDVIEAWSLMIQNGVGYINTAKTITLPVTFRSGQQLVASAHPIAFRFTGQTATLDADGRQNMPLKLVSINFRLTDLNRSSPPTVPEPLPVPPAQTIGVAQPLLDVSGTWLNEAAKERYDIVQGVDTIQIPTNDGMETLRIEIRDANLLQAVNLHKRFIARGDTAEFWDERVEIAPGLKYKIQLVKKPVPQGGAQVTQVFGGNAKLVLGLLLLLASALGAYFIFKKD